MAERWMIDNGRDMLKLMQVFPHEREEWVCQLSPGLRMAMAG